MEKLRTEQKPGKFYAYQGSYLLEQFLDKARPLTFSWESQVLSGNSFWNNRFYNMALFRGNPPGRFNANFPGGGPERYRTKMHIGKYTKDTTTDP